MKTNRIIKNMAALALLSTLNLQLSTAFAQGSLTPPGAPAPTMKSADQIYAQIEVPRTPISSAPFIITNSGSYYLTGNLTVSSGDAIDINTNGVTLDLNGFTISSTASGAGTAISLNSGLSDITIINGHIRGGGGSFGGIYGIHPTNVLVSKVSVSGAYYDGINVGTGNATVVENCTVTTAGGQGIVASIIKSSVATGCASNAIYGDTVSDCRGISNPLSSVTGYGVYASATAQNCYGQNGGGNYAGLYAGKSAQNCSGESYNGYGLLSTIAIGCYGNSGYGIGLKATIANGCYGSSTISSGLSVTNATSCWVGSGTTNICYKWNMP